MKKSIVLFALVAVMVFAMAVPAFAVNGSGGAGLEFGAHHAGHAQEMTGFTADENPGMHRGFAGWEHE